MRSRILFWDSFGTGVGLNLRIIRRLRTAFSKSIGAGQGWNRIAAVMYGLGAGLVADEIGLLLTPVNGTLGNYASGLTYTAVVVITAVTAMLSLLSRYRREIIDDFRKVGVREPLAFLGLFILVVPFVVQFVGLQASLLGVILAVLYRWKLGGPWRLTRRRGGFLKIGR